MIVDVYFFLEYGRLARQFVLTRPIWYYWLNREGTTVYWTTTGNTEKSKKRRLVPGVSNWQKGGEENKLLQIQYIVDGIHKERDEVAYRRWFAHFPRKWSSRKGKEGNNKRAK